MNDRLAFDLFGRGRYTENGMVQPTRQHMTEAVAAAEWKRSAHSTYTQGFLSHKNKKTQYPVPMPGVR